MKKLVTLTLLGLAGTTSVHAQTPLTKGRGLLTGSIGYRRDSYGTQATNSRFDFSPSVGLFVADNWVVGISLGVQSATIARFDYIPIGSPLSYNVTNWALSVGPFTRYYRFVGGDKFALFGQGGLGYIRTRSDFASNQGYVSVTPGLAFFPVPRFGIEASLRGLSYATDFNNLSSLDLGVSLRDFQLGAAYYFGK